MRIGINLLYLIPGEVGGTETFAVSLLRAMAQLDSESEYFLFLNEESAELEFPPGPNWQRVVCKVLAKRRPARYAWEQIILPQQLGQYRIDLVHSLGYVSPLLARCASVVSIYDLNYIGLKEAMPWQRGLPLRFFVPQSARRADQVVTSSFTSKEQIVGQIGIRPEKVTVTPGGARDPSPSPAIHWEELAKLYHLERPYLLSFGSLSAHKNLPRLIEAFQCLSEESTFRHDLVLVGHLPPGTDLEVEIVRRGLERRVHFTGRVPDEHVMPLLEHAEVFVFPSWYEGFGLPILDAQQAGAAVACSRAGSLPEVAGEGALYFDPYSVEEMAKAVRTILLDQELREALVHGGRENAKRFSWAKTAQQTLEVYRKVMAARDAKSNIATGDYG